MKKIVIATLCLLSTIGINAQTTMTLEDFRSTALQENKTLQAAEKNKAAATELKRAAITQFFPKITANATYQWNQHDISLLAEDALLPVGTKMANGTFGFTADQINNKWVDLGGGNYAPLDANGTPFDPTKNPEKILWKNYAYLPKDAMEFDIHNIFVGQIGVIQPVFMGFKIREMYRLAKAAEGLESVKTENQTNDLIVEVDEDYWRVVSVLNKKKLAEHYVQLLEKLDSNVNIMYGEGVATKADTYSVRVKLNEAKMALEKATNGLELSRMALFQLCGMPLDSKVQLADSEIKGKQIEPSSVSNIDAAIDNRAEIKSLEFMDQMAKSNVNIQASKLMPNLAVNANYVITNPSVYNGFSKSFRGGFNAGVVLNIPICQWGKEVHLLRAAKYQREALQYQIEDAKNKIRLQITQQNYKIIEANKKLESAESNVTSADENLRFASDAYDEGMIGLTDLMGAQTAWLSASSEAIDASIDVVLCDLYLRKAQGQSLMPQTEAQPAQENNNNKRK